MESKQLYHIVGEVVIIGGLSMYFMKQLKSQKEEIKELKDELEKYKQLTDKNIDTIYKILDKAFGINPQSFTPQQPRNISPQNKPSQESFTDKVQTPIQGINIPMIFPGMPPSPFSVGIIATETSLRHRNKSNADIQVIDDSQKVDIFSENRKTLVKDIGSLVEQKSRNEETSSFNIEDDEDDDDIQEELRDLENNETSSQSSWSGNQENMQMNQENIVEEIVNSDLNENNTLNDEKPFYPEPSKKKKNYKK